MQKLYLLLLVFSISIVSAVAQTDTLSQKDKAALDSMMKNDEFLKLMKDDAKNAVDISIGIGNGAFSADNKAANATGVTNQMIFIPSVLYRTKAGLSFGITGFLTNSTANNKLELYQTGLSTAYDYYGDDVRTGISYTRFLSDKNKYNSKSLYQNDFYGYLKKSKGILQPGLALGYSNGTYKEASLASFVLRRPLNPRGDTTIFAMDSTDNKASYFSASASVEHDFSFYTVFSKNDEMDFVPSLIINFGSDKLTQTHTNKIFDRIRKLSTIKKAESNNKFQVQSVAVSFDLTYSVGKFFLQPNLYLDYYLPETTSQRLSTIFSVTMGFTF